MKYKNVIVTGGAGFVGSHLVDALVDLAQKVIVIDKADPKAANRNDKAEYIKMNIQDEGVLEVFKNNQPEVVFHLAAHLHDRESVEMPIENAKDNVIGFLNVCEANKKTSRAKIVFMSSCAVYGNQEVLPINEEIVPTPQTPYGITKLVGENYLRFYKNIFGIEFIALRAANIYGPRQDSSAESGVIGIFSSRFINNQPVVINNDGQTTRDYIYVSDVVAALVKTADSNICGVFNLGTCIQTSTQQILDMVAAATGKETEITWNKDQQDALKNIYLDATKLRETFNWVPVVNLEEGIKKTANWYAKNIA